MEHKSRKDNPQNTKSSQCPLIAVRVKGGMSLRNGVWHGLRNDIIMRNIIYGEIGRAHV